MGVVHRSLDAGEDLLRNVVVVDHVGLGPEPAAERVARPGHSFDVLSALKTGDGLDRGQRSVSWDKITATSQRPVSVHSSASIASATSMPFRPQVGLG